jgi:hypothetical protein
VSGREPDLHWKGRPVYRCRICGPRFERVGNLKAVLNHEAANHAPAPPRLRESPILGADGQPLVVKEG